MAVKWYVSVAQALHTTRCVLHSTWAWKYPVIKQVVAVSRQKYATPAQRASATTALLFDCPRIVAKLSVQQPASQHITYIDGTQEKESRKLPYVRYGLDGQACRPAGVVRHT